MTTGLQRYKLVHAFHLMNFKNSRGTSRYRNSRAYEFNRLEHARAVSQKMRGRNLGMTYDEIYGSDRAKELRTKMKGRVPFNKGKSIEEAFGKERAETIREKIRSKCAKATPTVWTPEMRKNLSEKRKGGQNPSSIQCMIEGTVYNTVREAAANLGIHKDTVLFRLNSTSDRFSAWIKLSNGGSDENKPNRS